MRDHVGQGRFLICLERRGILQRIIRRVTVFVSATIKRAMWWPISHCLPRVQCRPHFLRLCASRMDVRGRLRPLRHKDELSSWQQRRPQRRRTSLLVCIHLYFMYAYIYIYIGTSLLNSLPKLVLFDLGTSWSFFHHLLVGIFVLPLNHLIELWRSSSSMTAWFQPQMFTVTVCWRFLV